MFAEHDSNKLPLYQVFADKVEVLDLPFSISELHGMMCGYICAGAASDGESYLRTLTPNQKDTMVRAATLAIFEVYSNSQQQLEQFDLSFQLLLPNDETSLQERAQAFSEWCEGFMQSMAIVGIPNIPFEEEEAQDVLQHLTEFAKLDYDSLQIDEEDEKAYAEVCEYARMAVLQLYNDLLGGTENTTNTKH